MRVPFVQADAERIPFADDTFDLTVTSPPYMEARTYGIAAQRGCLDWVNWMLGVVAECCRVTRGLVIVNCAGQTRKWRYQPGPEGLLWRWWERGGECWRPAFWHRVGIPGSGGKQWLRADVEYLLAFKRGPGPIPWADNLACGHPPKWAPGGEMSNRNSVGSRRNQWGKAGPSGVRGADGERDLRPRPSHNVNQRGHSINSGATVGDRKLIYINGNQSRKVDENNRLERGNEKGSTQVLPVLANPGNVIKVIVGGGVMGHPLAHENEAPFPEALAEFFVKSFCPPAGRVLDPFSGSGTTVAVARKLGRIGIGCDLRFNQCDLGRRRIATPHAKKAKKVRDAKPEPQLWEVPA